MFYTIFYKVLTIDDYYMNYFLSILAIPNNKQFPKKDVKHDNYYDSSQRRDFKVYNLLVNVNVAIHLSRIH